jgi:hypothetical protein
MLYISIVATLVSLVTPPMNWQVCAFFFVAALGFRFCLTFLLDGDSFRRYGVDVSSYRVVYIYIVAVLILSFWTKLFVVAPTFVVFFAALSFFVLIFVLSIYSWILEDPTRVETSGGRNFNTHDMDGVPYRRKSRKERRHPRKN